MLESSFCRNANRLRQKPSVCHVFALLLLALPTSAHLASAAEEASAEANAIRMAVNEEGLVVDFERDIAPIFREHCLQCHGAEEAKADFRVDERDTVFDYVYGEDLESSSMYIDYLISEDDDMLMPPRTHGGPLSPAELALIRIWIEEGANWPDDAHVVQPELDGSGQPIELADGIRKGIDPTEAGLPARVWSFQGFLHPATVHFPIALFLVGGLFVVLGWKWPALGAQVPLVCLLLGAATAIVATMMGWSFAVEKGYGSWTKINLDSELFWHRWSAIIVTVLSSIFAIIALKSLRGGDEAGNQRLTKVWKIGLLVVAGMVGAVGHQGGELTYGKDFYPKAISILLGQPWPPEETAETSPEAVPSESSPSETSPETTEDAIPPDATARADKLDFIDAIPFTSSSLRV
ncbi:MAG: c-type cytochrome domain-containing protein [Rhodopirellula sp. JB055]|uniref:c-type cytochrome domain-containing protein n=1 Tax=Rhodopirellula sp. JB055 TaxID=3342846 RepID=UPI00370CE10D